MPKQLLPEGDDQPCKAAQRIDREQHELTEILMQQKELIDDLAERVDGHDEHLAAMRSQVSEMAGALTTLGDLCYAFAAAAERLSADS